MPGPNRKPRPRLRDQRQRPAADPKRPNTDWSGVADWYDDLVGQQGSEYHREVVHPGVLKLLGDVKGKSILDVACGQGVLCRLLQERGATVTGVDASAPLIERARQHSQMIEQAAKDAQDPKAAAAAGPEIRYARVDARDLGAAGDIDAESFDAATCVLAIQNIHPFVPVFESVGRLLKPGGRFVVVMMHPCFRVSKESHWGWDDKAGVQYRRVDRYLLPRRTPITTHPGKNDGQYTWTFHRPIEDYVRAFVNSGMLVDALHEWPSHKQSQPGPRQRAENESRNEIPMFLALAGRRIG